MASVSGGIDHDLSLAGRTRRIVEPNHGAALGKLLGERESTTRGATVNLAESGDVQATVALQNPLKKIGQIRRLGEEERTEP